MKKILSLILSIVMVLTLVTFSVPVVGAEPISDSQGLQFTLSDDGTYYILSGAAPTVVSVVVPESVNGLPVKEIGVEAFYDITSLVSIEIPDTVTKIEKFAFDGCYYLSDIELPNSLTYIGHYAFNLCISLTSIKIPDSVTFVGIGAFSYCEGLETVEMSTSVTYIGDFAFSSCLSLTNFDIPETAFLGYDVFYDSANILYNLYENVIYYGSGENLCQIAYLGYDDSLESYVLHPDTKQIAGAAFREFKNLTNIEIPDSVVSIGTFAFYACEGLTEMNLPDNLLYIGELAFARCYNLESIDFGNSLESIGRSAFSNCNSLKSISLPATVSSIGDIPFYNCGSLESISVADGGEFYHSKDNCLIETETKTLVAGCKNSVIPTDGSVEAIADYAFYGAYGLTSIVIPETTTSIGNDAFYNCSGLVSISLPESLTFIGDSAFYGCSALTEIYIPYATTRIGTSVFKGCTSLENIYCAGRYNSTRDTNWKRDCGATIHWSYGTVIGDINGNGEVDAMDYSLLKRVYFGTFNIDLAHGDVEFDNEINVLDYTLLKRAYWGKYTIV